MPPLRAVPARGDGAAAALAVRVDDVVDHGLDVGGESGLAQRQHDEFALPGAVAM